MLRTPTFHFHWGKKLSQNIKLDILHWLQAFWKFSIFYGDYIATPPGQKKLVNSDK